MRTKPTKIDGIWQWARGRYQAHRRAIILLVIIAVSLVALSSNLIGRSFTSDDVAQQAYTHDLTTSGPHNILQENDTFILKLPVYMLFNAVTSPGRTQLLIESVLLNAIMIILFMAWWKYAAPKAAGKWLVFVWVLASGVYWMSQTVNPNTRNVDLGLMLLFALYVIRNITSPVLRRKATLVYLACIGALAGIITYDDPYFLFFVLAPLAAATLFAYRRGPHRRILAVLVIFLISMVVYGLLLAILPHFGLSIGAFNMINVVTATVTPSNYLLPKLVQILNGYLALIGASPSIIHSDYWYLPGVVFNFGVVCLALTSLYAFIRSREYSVRNLWIFMTIVASLGYLLLTGLSTEYIVHYLILLVPITGLLAALALFRLEAKRKLPYYLAVAVVSAALLVNVAQGLVLIYQKHRSTAVPNALDYQIISVLDKNGVTKSYGSYWAANISYYLSDYKNNVLPTICIDGEVYQHPTLVDTARLNVPSKKIGIIVDPDLVIPTLSLNSQTTGCTLQAAVQEFGTPQKEVYIAPSATLLIYTHSPWHEAKSILGNNLNR